MGEGTAFRGKMRNPFERDSPSLHSRYTIGIGGGEWSKRPGGNRVLPVAIDIV